MFGMTLTPEQRLHKAAADIMRHKDFIPLSGLLLIGSRTVKDGIPTAYTDGRDEYYGRKFIEYLTDAELRFVVAHEVFHKMYQHLQIWLYLFEEDAECANKAADFVINLQLDKFKPWMQMPVIRQELLDSIDPVVLAKLDKPPVLGEPLGCLDTQYAGMDTAQVYALLRKEKQQQGGQGGGQSKEKQQGGQGGGQSTGISIDEHGWQDAKQMDAAEAKRLVQEIDTALRQGALMAGKEAGDLDRLVSGLLDIKVPWEDQLREYVTGLVAGKDISTWSRPNRRYIASGIHMPGAYSEQLERVAIGIDTSGSIGESELRRALSEALGIFRVFTPERVDVLYWDTRVAGHETYGEAGEHPLELLPDMTRPKGGGGTDAACVPQYLHERGLKPSVAIMFTDGYVNSWGEWDCPVVWCVMGGNKGTAPCGVTIHVEV